MHIICNKVDESTILWAYALYSRNQNFRSMSDTRTYQMPYVGCLMGAAFQCQIIQLESALKREGLCITSAEYMILRALYSCDGLQQCEIVDMVGKDKAAISRSVAAMAKKGLVIIESVSYKCIRVWLSDKAKEIRPRIMKIADERHEALLRLVPKEDIETFVRVLTAIVDKSPSHKEC